LVLRLLIVHVGAGRRIPTCALRRTVVALRKTALNSEARAKPCLGPQARFGRKAIFGTESVEQTRAGSACRRLAEI